MSKLHDVSKLAGVLRGITIAAMITLPITIIGGLLATPLIPEAMNGDFTVSPDATQAQLIAATVLNLLSPLILIWILNEMRKLFSNYAAGNILTDQCAHLIQRIGQGFLALAIVPLVLRPIQSVLLTLANPPGQRSLAIGLNRDMIFFALAGGLVVIIGWAMREASDAASENRSFV